jgi:protein-tyrosine phosphatase
MNGAAGYVDIHSHVLYGLDDGAKTLEQSVQMLQMAASHGTTDVVATPHANARYEFNPDVIEQRIAEIQGQVDIRLHRGCDLHLQIDMIEDALAHPRKYTINHKNYLLIEFPDLAIFPSTDEILLQLLEAGIVPIVTHPERNPQLQQRLEDIARWVELGCYVQVTAASCTGTFGNRARTCAEGLIGRGMVHFIASDAHDCAHRSPDLSGAYASLSALWGEEVIRPLFVDNPRAVLTGATVDFEMPAHAVRRRKWYRFW